MVIEACSCDWQIPNVYELPPHTHYTERKLRRDSDGKVFTMKSHWLRQSNYTELEAHSEVKIWVPWKELARLLSLQDHAR